VSEINTVDTEPLDVLIVSWLAKRKLLR